MFERLVGAVRGAVFGSAPADGVEDEGKLDALEQHVPLRRSDELHTDGSTGEVEGFLCREAVLGRDQRIAGYQFMLREATRNRIRSGGRRIQHVYAEVLVRSLAQADIGPLLGHRSALLDIPDSFLEHPSLLDLPPANTVFVVTRVHGVDAAARGTLSATMRKLRGRGFRIALPVEELLGESPDLLADADFTTLPAAATDPERTCELLRNMHIAKPDIQIIARELPSQEDFAMCHALGASWFQGPFVTRREDWQGNRLGTNSARLAALIARLRSDADTSELVELLKQDAALSLRLMRYINSPAVGLIRELASIESALLQLGRDRLYRWLLLLLFASDKGSPRKSAALENALVRARLMELLGEDRSHRERESLYLVGLLSLVDVILELPLNEAVRSLGVAREVEVAVVEGTGPMADLLHLAVACEAGAREDVEEAAARCRISPGEANRRHLQAFSWALEINA